MSQTERRADKAEKSAPSNLIPPELAAMGKKRLDELVAKQTEQLEKLQEVNRNWIDRIKSQAKLGSELVAKLTAARTIPRSQRPIRNGPAGRWRWQPRTPSAYSLTVRNWRRRARVCCPAVGGPMATRGATRNPE